MEDYTRKFNAAKEKDEEIHHILTSVYTALEEKGYNPINQLVGYILSEDPTYITNHRQARTLIRKLDRDELLSTLGSLIGTIAAATDARCVGASGR
jgi:uncharacterized protein (UPF0297 family)